MINLIDINNNKKLPIPPCPIKEHACFPRNTMVMTPTGYVPIQKLKVDDRVYSTSNHIHHISKTIRAWHVFDYTEFYTDGDMYGHICSRNQPIMVYDEEHDEVTWKRADELKMGDSVAYPRFVCPIVMEKDYDFWYGYGQCLGMEMFDNNLPPVHRVLSKPRKQLLVDGHIKAVGQRNIYGDAVFRIKDDKQTRKMYRDIARLAEDVYGVPALFEIDIARDDFLWLRIKFSQMGMYSMCSVMWHKVLFIRNLWYAGHNEMFDIQVPVDGMYIANGLFVHGAPLD